MKELRRRQQDSLQDTCIFCVGGVLPPRQMVMAFIDASAKELGIEPICRELRVTPSSYYEHAARLADPSRRPFCARRDDDIRRQIKAGPRCQLRPLRHTQGLAPVAPRGDQGGQVPRGATDAGHSAGRHQSRKDLCDHRQQSEDTVPAGQRSTMPSRPSAPTHCRSSTLPMFIPGPASPTWPFGLRDRRLRPADRRLEGQHRRHGGPSFSMLRSRQSMHAGQVPTMA